MMPRRALSMALMAGAFAVAGGCAQVEGDFGRPRSGVIRDDVGPLVGSAFAAARGEPVSLFAMTDDERQLRTYSYAFLAPPEGFKALSLPVAELRAARVMANGPVEPIPGLYTKALLSYQYRSTTARWQRLIDDIRADTDRLAPVVRIAERIIKMDGVREQSLKVAQRLGETERERAVTRIAENRKLLEDVRHALAERIEIYHHAMEALLVAQPAPVAVEAEVALKALQDKAETAAIAITVRPIPRRPEMARPGYYPASGPSVVRKD